MELKDINELMKVLKKENLEEINFSDGKERLCLKNSSYLNDFDRVIVNDIVEEEEPKQLLEIIKSENVGKIVFLDIAKGMVVKKGMKLAKINTIGVESDIKSPVDGILHNIFVSDQGNVDYAKELFEILMDRCDLV